MSVVVQKVVDSATRLLGAQAGAFFYHLPGTGNETVTSSRSTTSRT